MNRSPSGLPPEAGTPCPLSLSFWPLELPGGMVMDFNPSSVINGDRKGLNWEHGGGWRDATNNTFPDWLEVSFAAPTAVDEIGVFSLQDNYTSPSEPTEQTSFTKYGVTSFVVQYWDGSQWLAVPGGTITNNNSVWRKLTFPAVTTTRVRGGLAHRTVTK